jgi:transposase
VSCPVEENGASLKGDKARDGNRRRTGADDEAQDLISKAMAKRITWMSAPEIAGVSDRTMRWIKQRYEEFGYDGLFDQRRGKRSIHRMPLEITEQALAL